VPWIKFQLNYEFLEVPLIKKWDEYFA